MCFQQTRLVARGQPRANNFRSLTCTRTVPISCTSSRPIVILTVHLLLEIPYTNIQRYHTAHPVPTNMSNKDASQPIDIPRPRSFADEHEAIDTINCSPTSSKYDHSPKSHQDTKFHLPNLFKPSKPHVDNATFEHIYAFINSKSGGHQGGKVFETLCKILPDGHVVNLKEQKPRDTLKRIRDSSEQNVRILACGGDGTGRWILEEIDKLSTADSHDTDGAWPPPVGVLPLGTGNDIGRVLGWGGGYDGEDLYGILVNLVEASVVNLDRWDVKVDSMKHDDQPIVAYQDTESTTPDDDEKKSHKRNDEEPHKVMSMNNYLSVGFVDAKVALDVHERREQDPRLFFHRNVNKLWYLSYAFSNLIGNAVHRPIENINDILSLEIDGQAVDLAYDLEGIIFLNLPSYAGGTNMWGPSYDPSYRPVSIDDNFIEVIGVRSIVHLGEISTGLGSGMRIGQGQSIRMVFKPDAPPLPCKVDGEPWLQHDPAQFTITLRDQCKVLCKKNSVTDISSGNVREGHAGWLHMRKLAQWKLRWCILAGTTFYYYATRHDAEPSGVVDLKTAQFSRCDQNKRRFYIKSPHKLNYWTVEFTNEDSDRWMEVLSRACEGLPLGGPPLDPDTAIPPVIHNPCTQ
eukprot:TRINITY_DN3486_c0_g1_i3.p1 TRINITY_DN3486_c0_g1~~TRINITY_DN3486_c0_g1_i3.p1  ORF type:complete len:629 (-),score=106.67 TRINITY_DN3486_c0_g1_i3:51-1937(-)